LHQSNFAVVEAVLRCGLPGRRVGHLQPLTDLILLPDVVVVKERSSLE
jgi:hypothetical protein